MNIVDIEIIDIIFLLFKLGFAALFVVMFVTVLKIRKTQKEEIKRKDKQV